MPKLRLIAVALLAASAAAPFGLGLRAEPLERDACKALEAQKRFLLTPSVNAALSRGPDWVKEHLHSAEDIEKVRQYLQVEEKVAFRCRTDGVRMPEPKPMPLPDRKPPVPVDQVAEGEPAKVLAGAASTSLLPLRKPSLSSPEPAETEAEAAAEQEAGDADEVVTSSDPEETEPGSSQTVADSDKTAPPENKATQ
jgi:hypothetical protein